MNSGALNTWQDVHAEIMRRIHSRQWAPGDLIPNETDLAKEFGCARTTVNRALREIAETGLLERRRKAGTRVATFPVSKATFSIPIIRHEIEESGARYTYSLITREIVQPPARIRAQMQLSADQTALHVIALHLAGGRPYVCENRWINPDATPGVLDADLSVTSANEWLLAHAPYTRGDLAFSAIHADALLAELMDVPESAALLRLTRATWHADAALTRVALTYGPDHHLRTDM